MGLLFFPRGGSAQVARYLGHALPQTGWQTSILTGSITEADGFADAAGFYRGLDVRPVDMTRALHARDPMAADPPLHPSYEERRTRPTGSSPRSTTSRPSTRSPPGPRRCSRPARRTPTSCTCTT